MPGASAGAAPPGSGPRRSERARIRRQPPDEAPPSPAATAAPRGPSSRPPRRRRGASPSRRSVRFREKDELQPPVVVLDEAEVNHQREAEKGNKQGKEIVEAEGPEEVDENTQALKEAPFWFPDGWIINVHHDDGGSIFRYYTSPVSEYTFSTDMEALNFLFSEMDEHVLESQACVKDNELHKMNTWLPDGWVIELRAGGKMMEKMYKFFVHLPTGMRFFSKEDVLRYVNEGAISRCDVNGLCDTTSEDNILAQVEFNPDDLPKGWVKELIFRKCNDGIRKHPYYTDPVSHLVFRTLKSVMSYLETGEISKHAYIPRRCVTHTYSFDRCTDLPRRMLKRFKVQGTKKKSMKSLVFEKKLLDDQTSNRSQGGTSATLNPRSEPKEKGLNNTMEGTGKEPVSSETTKRPRGRPHKIPKQTNESTPGNAKCSDKKTADNAVKKESSTGTGEPMSGVKALEYHDMEKHATVTLEVENKSDTARSPSSRRSGRTGLVSDPDMLEQRNGNTAGAQGGTSATMNPRSEPKEKGVINTMEATGNEPVSSETTKRPRGRPRKIPKETNEATPDHAKSSDKKTAHVAVKKESGAGTGEQMSGVKALDYHGMEKHATVTLEVDNKSDTERSPSSRRSGRTGLVSDPDMLEQENGDTAGGSAKLTTSAVPKVYIRRNSNQTGL